jgi:hypothetical protein
MDELDISARGELERLKADRDKYVEEKGLCAEVRGSGGGCNQVSRTPWQ